MALVKEYFELTKKYQSEYGESTIVLMQVGAFFEVYGLENKETGVRKGSCITDFSRICDLNIADKKICVGKEGVLMAGFSHYMIDKYIKKLQIAGYTIVVYTQDEQAKNTSRSLANIYSPGTYFSCESSNEVRVTNNTTCIWVWVTNSGKKSNIHVGLSNIDIYTGKTIMFEFHEKYMRNPTTFDELERFISVNNPSEVILIYNVSEKEADEIISYGNIECKSIHRINLQRENPTEFTRRALNCEKQNFQKEILEKFYEIRDFSIFSQNYYENTIATQSFCFLLDFIYQHNPNLVKKIHEPVFENCSDRMILANHTLKQLNIIDDGQYTGKFSSVEKMVNLCITPMGRRRFTYQFLNPSTRISYLLEEYSATDHMLSRLSQYDYLKVLFSQLKDLAKWSRQIVMKKISPKSLYQLYHNLQIIRDISVACSSDTILMEYLKSRIECPTIVECAKPVSDKKQQKSLFRLSTAQTEVDIGVYYSNYCALIQDFLDKRIDLRLCDDVDATQQFDVNFFKSGVDSELDDKSEAMADSMDKLEAIRVYLNGCISKYEKSSATRVKPISDYVKLHETEKNSFSLIATKRRCHILKQENGTKPDIELEYVSSYSGKTRQFTFTTEGLEYYAQSTANESITSVQIRGLCKDIHTIKVQLKDILTSTFIKLVEKMIEFQDKLDVIIQFVVYLDIIYTKAALAKKYNYCKPTIDDNNNSNDNNKNIAKKSFVDAKDLRHCMIEQLQQSELYVANDVLLNGCKGVSEKNNTAGILLYGTNAVGKTSFIRSLGIAVIMAQSGLYVPCSSFHFYPYKYIFTRILGNDNIFKGLSTFAVEMSELRTILRLANDRSLILGDELCSGTESISAASIFVAGIQQLQKKNACFIFATHLHEIIHYSEIMDIEPSVVLKHMAVVYDRERECLVYDRKLRDGPGDNMYGLEVCKSLHLPDDFLELAHTIRIKYHPEGGSILSLKSSHFNSKKLMGLCEVCKKKHGN